MTKIKCTVAYDGTQFHGYQVQPGKRTVQREIEKVLTRMHHGRTVKIVASGRTDAGVHALGQVFHFETMLNIPEERWAMALNSMLPDDIHIWRSEFVSDQFHARYDVKKKEYRYRLLTRPEPDLFRRTYTMHVAQPLDLAAMNQAAAAVVGTHDFSCFCAANTNVKDKVRTVYHISISKADNDETVIRIIGSGFLYQMVRIITGTLLDIGMHKLEPDRMAGIIEGGDRQNASATAPPHGLTLWQVTY
ncbi:tRNA pseudouridine(38-40) synthase TruA [Sporolactobacillus sp. CPB3-1]|uniref:tRNA pseudouridine synthase A n=1 Tax=Sporolactobacillus mangiferae TaxID=2940498 RepID=A0ABT0MC33_9BACL|nr:tRNA pseudouridine(38-40) synthase TruA [Sporolactobacillus mangiferae]MCL1632422.1 tRNA pseudouridine(38-40) synthase TruA [Sporolactobacillus mangiferae]